MSIINRKQEDRRINRDNEVPVPAYGPHDTLMAAEYKLAFLLAEFEKYFEHTCKSWLAQAKPDMYNRGYMDLMINQLMDEALKSLDLQEVDHHSTICELAKTWSADLIKAESRLEEIRLNREEVDRELGQLEHIYFKGTAYDFGDIKSVEEEEHE